MRAAVENITNAWGAFQRYSAAILLIAMTALYGFNVLVRALLPQFAGTFAWIDEAALYMMVWVVFLGVGVALDAGRHITINVLWGRLQPRIQRGLFALIDAVGLSFSVLMVVLSVKLSVFIANSGQISPTLGVPAYLLYIAPAVGFASLAFGFLLRLFSIRDARRAPVSAVWLGGDTP